MLAEFAGDRVSFGGEGLRGFGIPGVCGRSRPDRRVPEEVLADPLSADMEDRADLVEGAAEIPELMSGAFAADARSLAGEGWRELRPVRGPVRWPCAAPVRFCGVLLRRRPRRGLALSRGLRASGDLRVLRQRREEPRGPRFCCCCVTCGRDGDGMAVTHRLSFLPGSWPAGCFPFVFALPVFPDGHPGGGVATCPVTRRAGRRPSARRGAGLAGEKDDGDGARAAALLISFYCPTSEAI